MIMSRGRTAIYSRTFSTLLAETLHEHPLPPPSCAVSFVHVCQYVTDRYTDPSLSRILVKTRARDRDKQCMKMEPTGVLAFFIARM